MKAAPIFAALEALRAITCAKPESAARIPHDLWMLAMKAEIGLRQAMDDADLQVAVEVPQAEQVTA